MEHKILNLEHGEFNVEIDVFYTEKYENVFETHSETVIDIYTYSVTITDENGNRVEIPIIENQYDKNYINELILNDL